jgi:RHS repeat-associated protein
MKIGNSYYFYHNDHLGTPQKMTAVNGGVVWAASYTSFLKGDLSPFCSITNNLRAPGQYFDQETGLHYNHWRFYDPTLGRYLRADPIGLRGGINLFVYVQNSPIVFIDPFGLTTWKCKRPLGGEPGKRTPPVFNHQYNCVTISDGSIKCDSTNANSGWPHTKGPGTPSDPQNDYYDPNACEEVDDDTDNCVEKCLQEQWEKPRPRYDIGMEGVDCQEYTHDTFFDCLKKCN